MRRRPALLVLRIIGACLMLALLQACSVVRLAYNQADDALYWWLDGYFDFTDAQSLRLREDLRRLHAWHRRQELPGYADLLSRVQRLAAADVSADAACAVFDEARERLLRISERFAPTVAALAPGFSPAQIEHLERRLERRDRLWREEWLDDTPERVRERRVDRAVERAQRVYGRLEERQRAVVRASVDASVFDAALTLREAQRRQRDALDTLRRLSAAPDGAEQAAQAMRAVFDRSLTSPDPQYRAYFERLTRQACEATTKLHNSTTAAQREHAVRTLNGWEQDLRALASPQ